MGIVHIVLRHGVRHFCLVWFHPFRTHLLSPLNLKQFRAVVKPRHPVKSPYKPSIKSVWPNSTTPTCEFCCRPALWGQLVFSVGRVGASVPFLWLHAPPAVVPVQNSRRLYPPWFHRNVRRPWIWVFRRHHVMQGEEGYRKEGCRLTELFQRVRFLCMYSIWGWICSCLGYSDRFPSLNQGGFHPVSSAHLSPLVHSHTPSLCPLGPWLQAFMGSQLL